MATSLPFPPLPSAPPPDAVALDDLFALEDLYPELAQQAPTLGAPAPRPGVQSLQLSGAQQSQLLAQLREHYDEATQSQEDQEYRRALRFRRYMADPTLRDGMQPWTDAPQVFLAKTRDALERIVGDILEILLPDYEKVVVRGIGDEDVEQAKQKQLFTRWALEHLAHFRSVLKECLQDAGLDGLGILKAYPRRMSFDGWLTPEEQQQHGSLLALLQTIIAIETVDQGTLLLPPDATGLQYPEARYIGQQLWVHTIDDFPDLRARGHALKEQRDATLEVEGVVEIDERMRLSFARDSLEPQEWQRGRVELCEMYERFDVDGDGVREFVVVHWFPEGQYGDLEGSGQLSRVLLLKDALPQTHFPRPMWPYHPLRLWRQQRQLRGMNVPDRIETQQDILNRLIEQCLQQGEVDILPFFFYNALLTGELPDLTEMRPGQGVPLDAQGTVTFPPRQSQNRHYVELINLMTGFLEEDVQVTQFNQGRQASQPNAPRTVGGLALLLQEGNRARSDLAKEAAEDVTAALQYYLALWQHQMPSSVQIPLPDTQAIQERLMEESGAADLPLQPQTITAEAMGGLFDLSLKINPDALIQQQKQLTLAERLDPMVAGYPIGRRLLWKHVYEQLGMQEFDRFWPEEIARMETMVRVLQMDALLAQLEVQLAQGATFGLHPPPESDVLMSGQASEPGHTAQPAQPGGGQLLSMLRSLTGGGTPDGALSGGQGLLAAGQQASPIGVGGVFSG